MNIFPSSKDVTTTPVAEGQDLVGKMRVSEPQSLIDTDFEYGLQPTKWETLNTLNNKPTAFYDPSRSLTITDVTGAGTRVVTVATASPPAAGTPIFIQDTTDADANGWFLVNTVSAGVSFTYIASSIIGAGSKYDSTKTYIYQAYFFTGSGISTTSITNSSTTCTVTTTQTHNLCVGNYIYITGTTATTNAPNGSWIVASTPSANTFTFTVITAPTGTITIPSATTTLYSRPSGYVIHRAFDGGVHLTAGGGNPNASAARQTRRYFRYQSGKAIQFSTGTALKPNVFVDTITSSGTTATVTCRFVHNLQTGNFVQVVGCSDSTYNGIFQITVTGRYAFTYVMTGTPAVSPAQGFPIFVSAYSWYGNTNRCGIFDNQNGAFFEFDGQTLWAVRRKSVYQLSGNLTVTSGSNIITSGSSKFTDQLVIGDFIVLRGKSYRVTSIQSNTTLYISPEYQGATATGVVGSKTAELRIPQSQWNLDKCDGTGPSGYNIDLTRTQMMYIDYSWYGSGPIRWGFRTTNGRIAYVHQERNNNINFEAYFRSGNLPARYENTTIQPITTITADFSASEVTTLNVVSTTGFPPTGSLKLTKLGATGNIEVIAYTGLTATTFTGLSRTQTGGNAAAQAFTYSATGPQSVELVSQNSAAPLSHWGSSIIMDGKFDNDLNFQFNAGMSTALSIAAGATNALLSIRLAPSVDSGLTGVLGAREVVNRMQLKLASMDILTQGTFRINLSLNGQVSAGTFVSTGGSSLSQIATHAAGTTTSGGESILSFFTNNSGGSTNFTLTSQDLGAARDLGNSILAGGLNNTCPTTVNGVYPDGPDIITITATNIGAASSNILARLSWTEAQA